MKVPSIFVIFHIDEMKKYAIAKRCMAGKPSDFDSLDSTVFPTRKYRYAQSNGDIPITRISEENSIKNVLD